MNVNEVLRFHYEHLVGLDNIVQFGTHQLQIQASSHRKSYTRARVQVHEHLDGSLTAFYAGEQISWHEASVEARQLRA